MARAARGDRASRCSSTAPSPSARSTSTRRDADFYTISAQKWLCGPDSTGALYVRDPESLPPRLVAYPSAESLRHRRGHLGAEGRGAPLRHRRSRRRPSLVGLEAALADLPEERFARARELAQRLPGRARGRRPRGGDRARPGAPLVSFRFARRHGGDGRPRSTSAASSCVSCLGTGLLRASVGWWNDESDLERLVEALRSAADQATGGRARPRSAGAPRPRSRCARRARARAARRPRRPRRARRRRRTTAASASS